MSHTRGQGLPGASPPGALRHWASLLILLALCDAGHGPLTLADVADAGPLAVNGLLPQRHLEDRVSKQKRTDLHIQSRQC